MKNYRFLTMQRNNIQRAAPIGRLIILIVLRFLREFEDEQTSPLSKFWEFRGNWCFNFWEFWEKHRLEFWEFWENRKKNFEERNDFSLISFKSTSTFHYRQKESDLLSRPQSILIVLRILRDTNQSFGPAATKALPAAFVVNFSKFLMKRDERSLAFSSHAFLSA